jgi:hypothetical protein
LGNVYFDKNRNKEPKIPRRLYLRAGSSPAPGTLFRANPFIVN